jgi:hypothetical protein
MTKFLGWLKGLLKAFFRGCVLIWNWVQCIAQILMPLRFSIITIFLVALLFSWSAPGKDLLLSLADQKKLLTLENTLFFVALFFWALCLWYWSRVMMRFVHDDFLDSKGDKSEDKEWKVGLLTWFRKHIPRLMGLVPFIIMFIAFPEAEKVYSKHLSDIAHLNLSYLSWTSLGLGSLYYCIVVLRRGVILGYKNSELVKKHYAPNYENWRDLGRTSFTILFATLSLSTVIFIVVCINPQMATLLGTGSVLFLASASWVAFGSTMVSLGKGFKFPVIFAALIGAFTIGPCTDNHQVRTLDSVTPEMLQLTWDQRPTVEEDFKEWLATRSAIFGEDKENVHPIFIVAAEGGGIRAAYWTANLLAAFQDTNPKFADHVYALSGISGGSLGAALFVNLLKHQKDLNCDPQGIVKKTKKNRSCAHAILSEDFLTPTVASMLYPDLIQRLNFLSFIYKFPDRAYALETSFEKSWAKHIGNDRFSHSFLESWEASRSLGDTPKTRLPSLFLNSTWVEGGKRVIASNVQILKEHFPDAEDLFSILCSEIPLSTAVHNSARFSYVSPAGTMEEPMLDGKPCRQHLEKVADDLGNKAAKNKIKGLAMKEDVNREVWGHVVDGGYFENSGNTTTYDILSTIEGAFSNDELVCGPEDQPELQFRCLPVVITLINDPKLAVASKPDPDRWLTETLSPLKALFQTRDGRGSYARDSTRKYVEGRLEGLSLKFLLHDEEGALPLSWVLSELVEENIQHQVDEVLVKLGETTGGAGDPLNMEQLIRYRAGSQ